MENYRPITPLPYLKVQNTYKNIYYISMKTSLILIKQARFRKVIHQQYSINLCYTIKQFITQTAYFRLEDVLADKSQKGGNIDHTI